MSASLVGSEMCIRDSLRTFSGTLRNSPELSGTPFEYSNFLQSSGNLLRSPGLFQNSLGLYEDLHRAPKALYLSLSLSLSQGFWELSEAHACLRGAAAAE
eukprot:6810011-Alexandrium_andersonii.AAC.1